MNEYSFIICGGGILKKIGPLMILEGPNKSKVPFSRSLYIDSSEKVLIDTGAEPTLLKTIQKEKGIHYVVNTHYHPDHTCHNYLFPQAQKWINPIEMETVSSIEKVAEQNGIYQEWGSVGVEKWVKTIPNEWIESLSIIDKSYEYDKTYCFGGVNVVFLHTPGHTKGFSCPYFPDLGVVYTGDYDMTTFGPWYNGTDGDIDEFISSGKRLLTIEADTYITGHQKGIYSNKEFKEAMTQFLSIIETRDEKIKHSIKKGLTFEELTKIGIFYPPRTLDNMLLYTWERCGIRKHLKRLGYTVQDNEIKSFVVY